MENFCGKCGAPIGPDGRCLNCGAKGKKVKASKPEKVREERPARNEGKGKKKLIIILICVVCLAAVVAALFILGVFRSEKKTGEGSTIPPRKVPNEEKLERPNADDTMAAYGAIVNRIPAKDSQALKPEAEAAKDFADRGFTQNPVTASFTVDGQYTTATEISSTSLVKHPYYETTYITPDNVMWVISEVNGQMMAYPASYNSNGNWSVMHMVAENETVYGYDSAKNQFYELEANGTGMVLKRIDRIDTQTLDSLTAAEVER